MRKSWTLCPEARRARQQQTTNSWNESAVKGEEGRWKLFQLDKWIWTKL
jgi:hypothetical protein